MNSPSPRVNSRIFEKRKAFSLVELLAAVAVVGILSALIVPTASRMLDNARETKCASNLRQLHQLFVGYAADFDGWLPPSIDQTPEGGRSKTWNLELQRVGLVPKSSKTSPVWQTTPVFLCPSMKQRDGKLNSDTPAAYAMNNLLGPNSRNKKEGIGRLCEAVSPSKTYLFFDGIYKTGGTEWSGIAYSSGNNVQWQPLHGDGARLKVLFLDGHVESRSTNTVQWLATNNTDEAQTIAWRGAPQ